MGRRIISAVFVLVFAVFSRGETVFNVDVFWGWGGCYRPMEWTPVDIGVSSTLTEPFAGSIIVSAAQDNLNTMNIRHDFVLTPSVPLHVPLVTKLAFAAETGNVRLVDERGRTRWQYNFRLWDFSGSSTLTAINEQDLLIGFSGHKSFGLNTLDEKTMCQTNSGTGKVYIKDKLSRSMPWDWTGFASLDLLILCDEDWSELNRIQVGAICDWIMNGGRLLIVLGSEPLSANNPIAQMLPFEIGPERQETLGERFLKSFKLDSQANETVVRWPLKTKSDSNAFGIEKFDSDDCLFATGYIGFGRVGILSFNPGALSESQMSNSADFWVEIISKVLEDSEEVSPDSRLIEARVQRTNYRGAGAAILGRRLVINDKQKTGNEIQDKYSFSTGGAQICNNVVMGYFYNLPQLRPLSIMWVILLFVLLALLLGPIDYLVLKRLDKQPLTWVTSCFWIILFSVGAYYVVGYLRGGRLTFREVTVLDGIKKSACAWATTYSGLFAPSSDDYKLEGLADKQWWSGISPMSEHLYYYQTQQGAGRNIYFVQHDGKNLPESLPVSIWTMQCLLTESAADKLPIDAQVSGDGSSVTVKIENKSNRPIGKGYVLFKDNQALTFDSVPAKSTKEFTGQLRSYKSWINDENIFHEPEYYGRSSYYEENVATELNRNAPFMAQGTSQRSRTINAYLGRGAAVVCAEMEDVPSSYKVKNKSCLYEHIQLVRLVVLNE